MPMASYITPPTNLAGALRALRTRRGKTVAEMSEEMGKHESFWHKYETGERKPGLLTLTLIRETFDLDDAELLGIIEATAEDLGL